MAESPNRPAAPLAARQRLLITLVALALVALSWSGVLEQVVDQRLGATLERALITAAIARGLNGVISVAQGTEIAVQPVGVGVTITAGEILDPLNDLVERFSWLALVASASIATQILLADIIADPLVSIVVTIAAGVYLIGLWWPTPVPGFSQLARVVALIIFLRFLFTTVGLVVGWVDGWALEARQQAAMTELTQTRDEMETLNSQPLPALTDEPSLRERFNSLLDEGRALLDIESQLATLKERAESSIQQMLNLTVLFVVQTLLVPLGAFWLSLAAFRGVLGWIKGTSRTG